MKLLILTICLSLNLIECSENTFEERIASNRVIRALNNRKHLQSECRYEKEAWEECDITTGKQRRVLKLKSSRSVASCEPEKVIERPCKKNCRYSKGIWSECVDGSKHRTDTIKPGPTPGCEGTRNITKVCREQCNYQKSEWSVCENGVKTKTLTLQTDPGVKSGCEATKTIRKQCGHRQNRKERIKAKKSNPLNKTPTDE